MVRQFRVAALTFVGLASLLSTAARADYSPTISVTETPEAGGLTLLNYTLGTSSDSTLPISEFDLQVGPGVTLSGFSAPVGFDVLYTPGDTSLTFQSSDPLTDIGPGSTGVFAFLTNLAPGPGAYLIRGFSADGGSFDQTTPGLIIVSPVPEPSTLALGLIGGVAVWVGARRRRPQAG